MASNTYKQKYADGSEQIVKRSKKQGRKNLPAEFVKVPITIFVLPKTKEKLSILAQEHNMSLSSYGEIALSLFEINQFSTVDNCSIQ